MAPDLPPRYAPDAIFVARVARGKISRESTHPDHELRLWVGHTNMLDHLNHVILNAHEERISNRSNLHDAQQGSSLAKTESSIVSVERASTWAGETTPHDGQASAVSGPVICGDDSDEDSYSSDEGSDEDQSELSLQLCRQSSHPTRPMLNRISDECNPATQVTVAEVEVSELIIKLKLISISAPQSLLRHSYSATMQPQPSCRRQLALCPRRRPATTKPFRVQLAIFRWLKIMEAVVADVWRSLERYSIPGNCS
jgi:hypothetical protein